MIDTQITRLDGKWDCIWKSWCTPRWAGQGSSVSRQVKRVLWLVITLEYLSQCTHVSFCTEISNVTNHVTPAVSCQDFYWISIWADCTPESRFPQYSKQYISSFCEWLVINNCSLQSLKAIIIVETHKNGMSAWLLCNAVCRLFCYLVAVIWHYKGKPLKLR